MELSRRDLDLLSRGDPLGQRVAIFGGSFDPPTIAHQVVGVVVSHLVDRVIFVPAEHSPLKAGHHASFEDRAAMTRLLTLGRDYAWDHWSPTTRAEGPSYAIDTLTFFRDELGCEPVLVVGSDCYRELHRWHRFAEILSEFELFVVSRPGHDARNRRLRGLTKRGVTFLSGFGLGISSTLVRSRLASGLSCRHLVPDAVLDYVLVRGLYRPAEAAVRPADRPSSTAGDARTAAVGGHEADPISTP